jgi:RNA polymerase sigma factor (sigma-70 family)
MPDAAPPDARFPTTSWALVARAGTDGGPAVAELCRRYWYPLYAFARRAGAPAPEAEDLTQGFFAHFLEGAVYARADPARGRFRTFLLRCFRNYQANVHRAARAQKQGGGAAVVPLDPADAEARYRREPAEPADPERLYLRRWALTLIDEAFATLQAEYTAAGRGGLFDRLRAGLLGDPGGTYAAVGRELGMSADAVKQAAARLRARFGQALRSLVGGVVADPADVDAEVRDLMAALAG